ncbi:serine/threonine protein kinase, partial [Xanthomonas citri pv. citri]|nr:serine/threonine protein kinase [Xanthomonas citri pv. citri]
ASELRSWRNGEQPVRLVSPRSRPVRPTPQPMPRPQPVRSAPSATSVATQQRGSGWVIALLAVLVLVGAGVFFYVKGMPGSHSDAAPQPTQAPISTS